MFFGKTLGGRAAHALGYTGFGVGASRFGALLDLLDGRATEATKLSMARRRPLPFPPEPLRSGVIELTRIRLAAADRNGGHGRLGLTALDRMGWARQLRSRPPSDGVLRQRAVAEGCRRLGCLPRAGAARARAQGDRALARRGEGR